MNHMSYRILYEDKQILVCYKPAGLAVQSGRPGQMDLECELKNYLAKKRPGVPYLGIVHRLDQPVEGVLVFAKDSRTAAELNRQLSKGAIRKKYYAVVCGKPSEEKGHLVDYLIKESRTNTARVVGKEISGAKRAVLSYETLDCLEESDISLVEIEIETGRFHQIRVQMAHAGFPLVGDCKYGGEALQNRQMREGTAQRVPNVALCAYCLAFCHPVSGKKMCFRVLPQNTAFLNFKQILERINTTDS